MLIERIDVGDNGGLQICLSSGYSLHVVPNPMAGDEDQWRLMPPGNDSPHFVLLGTGFET
jgi:hypothetical protein